MGQMIMMPLRLSFTQSQQHRNLVVPMTACDGQFRHHDVHLRSGNAYALEELCHSLLSVSMSQAHMRHRYNKFCLRINSLKL